MTKLKEDTKNMRQNQRQNKQYKKQMNRGGGAGGGNQGQKRPHAENGDGVPSKVGRGAFQKRGASRGGR